MLETEIRQVFSRQAEQPPPPARISLPAARQAARTRRAWRRAGVLGAPLLAAAAVISIAVASVIPGGGIGLGQGPVASPVAPQYFNPLRPYASFGWLPAGLRLAGEGTSQMALEMSTVETSKAEVNLIAYAASGCHLQHGVLTCLAGQGALPTTLRLLRQVGSVDGHPAYLTNQHGILSLPPYSSASPKTMTSPPPSSSAAPSASPTADTTPAPPSSAPQDTGPLVWQYARGGWATLLVVVRHGNFLPVELKVARSIRFGPAVAPPIRFAYQLVRVPADWRVSLVGVDWLQGVPFARTYTVTAGQSHAIASFSASTPLSCGSGPGTRAGDIDGYRVVLSPPNRSAPVFELCASDADGLGVGIQATSHPSVSLVNLFAHHIRLIGPDPRTWTTVPVR
jgi:hypothetical protein